MSVTIDQRADASASEGGSGSALTKRCVASAPLWARARRSACGRIRPTQSLAGAAESDHMATTRPKKIPLATQRAARLATRTALEPFGRIPDDVELTLGTH